METFSSFFALKFIFLFWKYRQNSKMTKTFETKVYLFHANTDIKTRFTFFKQCTQKMKTFINKSKKTALSWSFYAIQMNKCMHSLRCKCTWCKCNGEKLNTKDFQQGQLSLIQKVIGDLFFEMKHMTWTNDPKPNPKEILQVLLTDINALVLPFFAPIIWPSHESPPFGVHLRFKVWPLCSPLSVVIYLFCSLSIRSKF